MTSPWCLELQLPCSPIYSTGVQVLVDGDVLTVAGYHLLRPGDRIGVEQHAAAPGSSRALTDLPSGVVDLGARGDIQAGFDDVAVVAWAKCLAPCWRRADIACLSKRLHSTCRGFAYRWGLERRRRKARYCATIQIA